MRYTLLLHYPEMTAEDLGPEALAEGMAAFDAYAKALDAAGVLRVRRGAAARRRRRRPSRWPPASCVVQDGPFADTKEQLGGTFVIDVPDLDAALDWAQQAPPVAVRRPSRSAPPRPTSSTGPGPRTSPTGDGASPTPERGARRRARGARLLRAARRAAGRLRPATSRCAEDALADAFERALRTLAGRRRAGQPGRMAAHRGPQPAAGRAGGRPPVARAARWPDGDARLAAGLDVEPSSTPTRSAGQAARAAVRLRAPAIDPAIRTPLMLQTVLGFDAAEIARAFAVPSRPRWRSGWSGPSGASGRPASRSRCRRASGPRRAAARGARGGVRRVRDRLPRRRRRLADEARYLP